MASLSRRGSCIAFQTVIGIERELAAGTLVFVPLSDKRLPLDRLRRAVPTGEHADRLISRGVAPDQATLEAEYLRFVDGAEGHVRFEVLLIDYEQLLESEIGRSMHEAHVLDQRENQVYKGRLATNVEALMNWLFAFALSPCTSFDELPIRMRGTYLPDYFDRIHRRLYELPHGQHGLTM
jgi:hypothetical protein